MLDFVRGRTSQTEQKPNRLVFLWENFGPMHVDRCEAVAECFAGGCEIIGLELASGSHTYAWPPTQSEIFRKLTLFPNTTLDNVPLSRRLARLLKAAWSIGSADFFVCHYETPEIFFTALALRLFGRRVFVMNDSKFDDKQRRIWRELMKSFALIPYNGAIAAGARSSDYMRFIHFKPDRIAVGYDTLSIARIRKLAAVDPAPNGAPFASRHFTIIARFVPKKNLSTALVAYSLYVQKTKSPRPLHLCGSGELEAALNEQVEVLGLQGLVFFRGFLSAQEIAGTLANTLALLLVSKEEQFGLAVIEAQAMGVPVIYTRACGARDELLRSGVNGFLVEANNPPGIAYFMTLIASDEPLWRKLAKGTLESAYRGDVGRFVEGVEQLRSLGKQH